MPAKKTKPLAHHFKPGQSGNPTGRPKGSRNKVGEAFLQELIADWEIGGAEVIKQCRLKDPAAYLRIVASLIPKDCGLKGDEENSLEVFLDQFTSVEEIRKFIAGIKRLGNKSESKAY